MNGYPPAPFTETYLIRFSQTDMAGIVYYPNYFDMFQTVVEDWFDHWLGVHYADLIARRKVALPSVKVGCEFLRPTRIGDRLALTVHLSKVGRSSVSLTITGSAHGEACLRGEVVLVTISLESFKSISIPDDIRAGLEAYRQMSVT